MRHALLPHSILPACTVSRPPSLLAHQELLTAAAVGRKAVRRPRDHNVTPPPTPPATPRHPLSALLDSHGALLWLVLALRIACPSTESRSGWYNPPEGGGAREVHSRANPLFSVKSALDESAVQAVFEPFPVAGGEESGPDSHTD